jgi:antitoxin (DNA-binding transcriptional repressor) of toxin-antitoxin stability system
MRAMADVSTREPRTNAGQVSDEVIAGDALTVTRHGHPVARQDLHRPFDPSL